VGSPPAASGGSELRSKSLENREKRDPSSEREAEGNPRASGGEEENPLRVHAISHGIGHAINQESSQHLAPWEEYTVWLPRHEYGFGMDLDYRLDATPIVCGFLERPDGAAGLGQVHGVVLGSHLVAINGAAAKGFTAEEYSEVAAKAIFGESMEFRLRRKPAGGPKKPGASTAGYVQLLAAKLAKQATELARTKQELEAQTEVCENLRQVLEKFR
jgi:hypothetical protein